MPPRPETPCTYPGCPNTVSTPGRCPEHRIRARDRLREEPWSAFYRTQRWHRLSAQVLREEPWCRCGPECCPDGCHRPSTVADHVIPARVRPDLKWVRSNIQGLAASPCHGRKTAREVGLGGARV